MTTRQLIAEAFQEIGVIAIGDTLSDALASVGLEKLKRLLNSWNADRQAVYADQFPTFTLIPSLQPHTIGPSGATWTTARPVSIEGAQLVLSGGSTITIHLHQAAWWQGLPNATVSSATPTDGYYDPTFPNGSLYLFPVPTSASSVQLLVRRVLDEAITLATVFTLPPGYREAVTLTLAEACAGIGAVSDPGLLGRLAQSATKARAVVFMNNLVIPPLITQDSGMPAVNARWFDYRTGGWAT